MKSKIGDLGIPIMKPVARVGGDFVQLDTYGRICPIGIFGI